MPVTHEVAGSSPVVPANVFKQFLFEPSCSLLALLVAAGFSAALGPVVEGEPQRAQVTIHADREGCQIELDAANVGKTDAQGDLNLSEVEPSDHYIHVRCPGERERAFFIEPRTGQKLAIRVGPDAASRAAAKTPIEMAQAKIELRRLVLQAVQLRARGHLEEAVHSLREAIKLDSENTDLHHELGITFLMGKDWKRARVELLETVRHEPDNADAHNGLGYALEKLGALQGAVKEYRTASKLDPDDSSYRQHYIEALAKLSAAAGPGAQAAPQPSAKKK